MWEHGDVEGVLKYFREDKLRCLDVGNGLAQNLYLVPAEKLHKRRLVILRKLKIALLLTCITIVFSLAVLSTVHWLTDWLGNNLVTCILIIGVFLASLCIIFYAGVVLAIFQK
jgi:hypothetical protein